MTRVSISEAARLTGKSRTTLHRLIKTGELSTCSGERNKKWSIYQSFYVFSDRLTNRRMNTLLDKYLNSVIQRLLTRVNMSFVN